MVFWFQKGLQDVLEPIKGIAVLLPERKNSLSKLFDTLFIQRYYQFSN